MANKRKYKTAKRIVSVVVGVAVGCGVLSVPAHAAVFHRYWIGGAIEETYHRLGGHPKFGDAVHEERVSGRNGRFQAFVNNASIYWHPDVDHGRAHEVEGLIRDRWAQTGWENGPLGYPTNDESPAHDPAGRFNNFEDGSIYWNPRIGAYSVQGDINRRWTYLGRDAGLLGLPTTNETVTSDPRGRFNHFEKGSIYWTPQTGAVEVTQKFQDRWAATGWEGGALGFPIAPAIATNVGEIQNFEKGRLILHESVGPVARGKYTGRDIADYRRVFPIVWQSGQAFRDGVGLAQRVISDFWEFDGFKGSPDRGRVEGGKIYSIDTLDGRRGDVKVSALGDDGLLLETMPGHPEGSGRTMRIRFETAPRDLDEKGLALDTATGLLYVAKNENWLRMVVEVGGPISDSETIGPFNDESAMRESFLDMVTRIQAMLLIDSDFHYVA